MSKHISTIDGHKVIVDGVDLEYLLSFNWRLVGKGYAATGSTHYMHTSVLERKLGRPIKQGFLADHINQNKLDNRRQNLRELTYSQNTRNSSKLKRKKTSRFWGVSRSGNKWRASARRDGKVVHFGRFDTEEDAARAYDAAALEHHGEFASLNFPEKA